MNAETKPKKRKSRKYDNVVYIKQVQERKRRRIVLLAVCGVVVLIGGIKIIGQLNEMRTQNEEYARLEAQLEEKQQMNQSLTLELQYMMTEDYVLSVARDQLGLLKENEIRFVEDTSGN